MFEDEERVVLSGRMSRSERGIASLAEEVRSMKEELLTVKQSLDRLAAAYQESQVEMDRIKMEIIRMKQAGG